MDVNAVRIETFLLCRSLEIHNNEFFIMGGGWTTVGFYSFPGVLLPFSIAVRLMVPFTETNQDLEFKINMEDADGKNILPKPMEPKVTVGRPVTLVRGEEQAIHFPLGFNDIELPSSGTYSFVMSFQGRELARTSFTAVPLSPGAQLDR